MYVQTYIFITLVVVSSKMRNVDDYKWRRREIADIVMKSTATHLSWKTGCTE